MEQIYGVSLYMEQIYGAKLWTLIRGFRVGVTLE